jgi:hypothetical protein
MKMAEQPTRRGIGFFTEEKKAEQGIRALESSDFPMQQVSIVAKQLEPDQVAGGAKTGSQVEGQEIQESRQTAQRAGATALWGSLLGGFSSLAFPGVGAVIAAGSVGAALVTTVAGEGAGAAASLTLENKLKSLGIPQQQAAGFSDRLIKGQYMVIIDGNSEEMSQAESTMTNQNIQAWDTYQIPANS